MFTSSRKHEIRHFHVAVSMQCTKKRDARVKLFLRLFNLLRFCLSRCRRRRHCLGACLHEGGGPQVGEVTRLGGVTRLAI